MTAQQIDYWKLQESKRANQATEAENATYHRNSEKLQTQINAETERHNRATEYINQMNVSVSARNAATNALNAETNRRLADLTAQRDAESARHNAALEGIQSRYNDAVMAFNEKKLSTDVELAGLQRSSTESIAEENRKNSLNIATMEDATKKYLGELGAVTHVGGDLVNAIPKWSNVSPAAKAVGGAVATGLFAKAAGKAFATTSVGSKAITTGAAKSLGTKAAISTAATAGAGLAIPAAMILAGGLIGGTLAKNNVPYPFSTNFDYEEEKKGVKWYGAQ